MTTGSSAIGPRMGAHAAEPGKYYPATRIDRPVVDPGEMVRVQVYISGYGRILGSKLHFAPPLNLLNSQDSRIRTDLKMENGDFKFGARTMMLDEAGSVLALNGGISFGGQPERTNYFDAVPASADVVPPISTEQVWGDHTFADYLLAIRKDARPNTYALFLTLTYFNGAEWQIAQHTFSITVRNFYQRRETAIAAVAVAAAAATVLQTLLSMSSCTR